MWRRCCAIAAVLSIGACAASLREEVRVAADGIRFQVRRPAASSMVVAGDFNGWSATAHPMTRAGDMWSCIIALPPGEHLFMYIVDGTSWVTPPNAPEVVPDGFGGWNGKIIVP
jgi:1,4-alpha-glucan branching enzyme